MPSHILDSVYHHHLLVCDALLYFKKVFGMLNSISFYMSANTQFTAHAFYSACIQSSGFLVQ